MGLPTVVRFIRALALAEGDHSDSKNQEEYAGHQPPSYRRDPNRWVVLPINVVQHHQALKQKMDDVRTRFETSFLNSIEGSAPYGVITVGFMYNKLRSTLDPKWDRELSVLRLATLNPLPTNLIQTFSQGKESILVLEESAPILERAVRGIAQGVGMTLPIYGRDTDHVKRVGELFSPQIAYALNRFLPSLDIPIEGEVSRPRPSRDPLCEGCPYIPVFEALLEVVEEHGGREEVVIVGDPGCMVRGQLSPYEIMDVKHSLGSSIGMASGIAFGLMGRGEERRVIALCGDSGFLHSGLAGLVDAVRMEVPVLVIILDNGLTALSGGQPHPASSVDARGASQPAVDLVEIARKTGVGELWEVDLDRGEDIRSAITQGMDYLGTGVIIARGRCVHWSSN
jgi:indolepyruvate ferredoxin oxidoreductase alpha subunit